MRDGRETHRRSSQSRVAEITACVTLFIAWTRDEGPAATRAVQYARENKAIFHSWSRGRKFLMSEILRLPFDIGETWRVVKLLKSK